MVNSPEPRVMRSDTTSRFYLFLVENGMIDGDAPYLVIHGRPNDATSETVRPFDTLVEAREVYDQLLTVFAAEELKRRGVDLNSFRERKTVEIPTSACDE